MIERVVDMNRNILVTASMEPTVKRFVYTSSSEAAVFSSFLEHDKIQPMQITSETWNEIAINRVRGGTSSGTPKEGFDVYAASKTLGEQAIWDWVKKFQPGFKVNTGNFLSHPGLFEYFNTFYKFYRRSASGLQLNQRSKVMRLRPVGQRQSFEMSFTAYGLS